MIHFRILNNYKSRLHILDVAMISLTYHTFTSIISAPFDLFILMFGTTWTHLTRRSLQKKLRVLDALKNDFQFTFSFHQNHIHRFNILIYIYTYIMLFCILHNMERKLRAQHKNKIDTLQDIFGLKWISYTMIWCTRLICYCKTQ